MNERALQRVLKTILVNAKTMYDLMNLYLFLPEFTDKL